MEVHGFYKLAMSFGSTLTFSQHSPGEHLNPWIHRSAPCHKSTAHWCENHTWPQKACSEQPSNSPECSVVYSVQTGGKKCFTSHHNSSQKERGELRNSACSSWTLYFPSLNTEINLGLATKASPWRDILPHYFMAKQKLLQEIQGLAAEFFSLGPVQCEPICFSPHNPLLSLFSPSHIPLLFFFLAHWVCSAFLKTTKQIASRGRLASKDESPHWTGAQGEDNRTPNLYLSSGKKKFLPW